MNVKKNNNKKTDIKDRASATVARQAKEIESLKMKISKLEESLNEKDMIIEAKENENAEFMASVDYLRDELKRSVEEVKQKSKEYDDVLAEVRKMRDVLNEEIYKGKWSLIKFLIK